MTIINLYNSDVDLESRIVRFSKSHTQHSRFDTKHTHIFRNQPSLERYTISYSFHEFFKSNFLNKEYVNQYEDRIDELRNMGKEEQISIRPESESDFLSFISLNPKLKKCSLALLERGSLSALWTSKSEYRAAIRFLGDGKVQFTFITYKQSDQKAVDSIDSGKCNIDEIGCRLEEFGLLFK